ncbi:hypothetical protein [Xanthomarina gelatinilytica]|jgi:hypothetical protein|uniref:Uncharacterized protein n=1 Tax=Xanthomarina gelatinilytica TaxID=1137281 RepID=M7ND53_9FLAO|nr:hypothetical protein [Xanthomarina gelatinilytica]EMQ96433.1 hypothetical protein D778_02323 [Xanthomarina gelatinilytica]MDX1318417.1 hypothetical protein [Xanthomarina gelatinilytica]
MNALNILLEKIDRSKTLDFGDIFSNSIELFKKVWVQGLIMMLLMMVILIPFYLVMYLPFIGMGFLDMDAYSYNNDISPILMIPFFIMIFVFSIVAMVLSFGMKASFYRICKMKDLNEAGSDDYFYYLKKPYLGKVIVLSLMTFGISLLATLLCFLPIIYVMVPITLINVIFAFNPDLSASDIIKAGFRLGNKKWLITFGLIVISAILAELVGLLMCFVGIFVTASFSYIPAYFVYKESVGFQNPNDI